MSFIKHIVFGIVMLFVCELSAQQMDTTSALSGVEIKAKRVLQNQSATRSTQNISKAALKTYSSSTLNELLSKTTNITINQYGASGISSVSMRGGNANHTAVLWNGFNLQDPLNGEFNVALSTVNIIDEISVEYGGNSALFGSGAVGGTISLNNKAKFNSGLSLGLHQGVGSFGKQSTLGSVSYGTSKLYLKTRAFYSYVKNDFEYTNYAKRDFPTEVWENAELRQCGLLQEAYYLIDNNKKLSAQVWYQNSYSQVAQNMTVEDGASTQYDDVLRIATAYNQKFSKWDFTLRNGISASQLHYIDDNISLDATHKSFNNITDAIADYKFNIKNSLIAGINNNYMRGESPNFAGVEQINATALFLSYKYQKEDKLMLSTNIRSELIDGDFSPITYGLKMEYKLLKFLSVNTNLSKNYRSPNFNDLYWAGSYSMGNPDLKAEEGFSADLGSNLFINKRKFNLKTTVTGYFSRFSNLILWEPIGGTWTPQNKKLVDTEGIEFRTNVDFKHTKNIKTFATVTYTYTSSKLVEKSDIESEDVLNKQLIYIPLYQANASAGISYKGASIAISVKYVGQRYVLADNSDWLDPYVLTDLNFNYNFEYKKLKASVFAKANNIFNTEYMVRDWYPTPLVNYELGIKLYINQLNK